MFCIAKENKGPGIYIGKDGGYPHRGMYESDYCSAVAGAAFSVSSGATMGIST